MACCQLATSQYLNQWCPRSLMHKHLPRHQWVNNVLNNHLTAISLYIECQKWSQLICPVFGDFSLIEAEWRICINELTIIASDNGFSPGRHQANAGILLIQTLGTNCVEILSDIHIFSFRKMHLKMAFEKMWPFCLSLNLLKNANLFILHFPLHTFTTSQWCHNECALWLFTQPLFRPKKTSKLRHTQGQ